jgi:hypothetical protein
MSRKIPHPKPAMSQREAMEMERTMLERGMRQLLPSPTICIRMALAAMHSHDMGTAYPDGVVRLYPN